MPPIPVLNIASPEFKANPIPAYARLRSEAPVDRTILPDKQSAWLITRYEDVLAVLKDERFGKDRLRAKTSEQVKKQPWMPNMFKPLTRNMLDVDAPDRTRLRGLVQKAFMPRLVEEGQIAISTLLRRIPDLQLATAVDALRWKRGLVLRGLESLPVVFSK